MYRDFIYDEVVLVIALLIPLITFDNFLPLIGVYFLQNIQVREIKSMMIFKTCLVLLLVKSLRKARTPPNRLEIIVIVKNM